MGLKDDSQYYTFTYFASLTKGGEVILSYTAEELDEKGIDEEELEESIQAGEKFDGYFWRRTRTHIKCGEEGMPYEKDADLSEDYIKHLEKVRNTKVVKNRKDERIYEEAFIKEMKSVAIDFCDSNDFPIGVKISPNGNLCLWKNKKLLITFCFKKDDEESTKTLLGIYNDIDLYEEYRLWGVYQEFQNKKGTLSYDGRSIIFVPWQPQNNKRPKPKIKNKKPSKEKTMRRNNIENTR